MTTILICKAFLAINTMYASHLGTPQNIEELSQIRKEVAAECDKQQADQDKSAKSAKADSSVSGAAKSK